MQKIILLVIHLSEGKDLILRNLNHKIAIHVIACILSTSRHPPLPKILLDTVLFQCLQISVSHNLVKKISRHSRSTKIVSIQGFHVS